MEDEKDVQGQQPDEMQELESFLEEESAGVELTPEQIANKKADFYKGLLKKERSNKAKLPEKDVIPKKIDIESRLSEQEQRVELRMMGYSVDEIREIEAVAKGKNIQLLEAEKSPFVKSAITQIRAEMKSKEAVLEPGNSNVMVGDKNAKSVLADPSATPAEKQSAMDAIRAKKFQG